MRSETRVGDHIEATFIGHGLNKIVQQFLMPIAYTHFLGSHKVKLSIYSSLDNSHCRLKGDGNDEKSLDPEQWIRDMHPPLFSGTLGLEGVPD